MNRYIKLIASVAGFIILIGGAYFGYKELSKNREASGNLETESARVTVEGSTSESATQSLAPSFRVLDAEGRQTELSSLYGKPIILNFWASWCPPCKKEMPDFEEAYKTYGDEIQFVIVNMTDGSRETVDTATKYIKDQGYTFPVYFDTNLEAANAYQVYSIPTTYFIDKNGSVAAYSEGMLTKESLEQGIAKIK